MILIHQMKLFKLDLSKLLGLPSWDDLANKIFCEIRKKGGLNYSEIDQLRKLDPKKKLSIAHLIAEENEIRIDLKKYFTVKMEGDSIYKSINDIGCTCVTTNYDELLAPRYDEIDKKDSTTHVQIQRITERDKFFAHILDEPGTVVHLHG